MKRIPEEKITKIYDMKEAGATKYAIAKDLGISTGAVSYHLKRKLSVIDDGSELVTLRKQNKLLIELVSTYQ